MLPQKFLFVVIIFAVNSIPSESVIVPGKWFEQCDQTFPLGPDKSIYINSPYYPKKYMSKSSCRYYIVAPMDYEINMQCNIDFDKDHATCSTEHFYISVDGDLNLTVGESFCGQGYAQRISIFRAAVIAYTSSGTYTGGSFSCLVETQPQMCRCGYPIIEDTNAVQKKQEVQPNEFPMFAGFVNLKSGKVFCGGTIISHRYIVTAASCFSEQSTTVDIVVRVGRNSFNSTESQHQTYSIVMIIQHPQYDTKLRNNDIALAMTHVNIEWSFDVGPACLPFSYSFYNFENEIVQIIGWKPKKFMGPPSTIIRTFHTNIIAQYMCKSFLSDVTDSQLCTLTDKKDECLFDAGSPLLHYRSRWFIVGITGMTSSCGLFIPTVHARITPYLNWIEHVVGTQNVCKNK